MFCCSQSLPVSLILSCRRLFLSWTLRFENQNDEDKDKDEAKTKEVKPGVQNEDLGPVRIECQSLEDFEDDEDIEN